MYYDFRNEDTRNRLRTEALIEFYEKRNLKKHNSGGMSGMSVSTMFDQRNNDVTTSASDSKVMTAKEKENAAKGKLKVKKIMNPVQL